MKLEKSIYIIRSWDHKNTNGSLPHLNDCNFPINQSRSMTINIYLKVKRSTLRQLLISYSKLVCSNRNFYKDNITEDSNCFFHYKIWTRYPILILIMYLVYTIKYNKTLWLWNKNNIFLQTTLFKRMNHQH